jgi:hypothetical protein
MAVQLQHRSVQLQQYTQNSIRKKQFRTLGKDTEMHVPVAMFTHLQ